MKACWSRVLLGCSNRSSDVGRIRARRHPTSLRGGILPNLVLIILLGFVVPISAQESQHAKSGQVELLRN